MRTTTTVGLSKETVARLRELIKLRGRKESIEQIVIELLSGYKG
jgi:hypothetical protein